MIVSRVQQSFALTLFDAGAVKINPDKGFRLADGTISPIYFNLRTPDHPAKPGPLIPELLEFIGERFYALACYEQLPCDAVAGVPQAGEPLARALSKSCSAAPFPIVTLEKVEGRRSMRVTNRADVPNGSNVLVVDDVITGASSKVRAIVALRGAGFAVTDVLVLIDREQGGRPGLTTAGCNLHAVFTAKDLLSFYHSRELIPDTHFEVVTAYLEGNPDWQATAKGGSP